MMAMTTNSSISVKPFCLIIRTPYLHAGADRGEAPCFTSGHRHNAPLRAVDQVPSAGLLTEGAWTRGPIISPKVASYTARPSTHSPNLRTGHASCRVSGWIGRTVTLKPLGETAEDRKPRTVTHLDLLRSTHLLLEPVLLGLMLKGSAFLVRGVRQRRSCSSGSVRVRARACWASDGLE